MAENGFEQLEDIIQSVVLNASDRMVDAAFREYPDDYNYIMNVKSDKPNQAAAVGLWDPQKRLYRLFIRHFNHEDTKDNGLILFDVRFKNGVHLDESIKKVNKVIEPEIFSKITVKFPLASWN